MQMETEYMDTEDAKTIQAKGAVPEEDTFRGRPGTTKTQTTVECMDTTREIFKRVKFACGWRLDTKRMRRLRITREVVSSKKIG